MKGDESTFSQNTGRDRSKLQCFNCNAYGHYATECHRPKRVKERKPQANLTQIDGDEPTLLLSEYGEEKKENMILLNEGNAVLMINPDGEVKMETNVWYLDNGASNHMTSQRSKFSKLDESVTGQVKFGNSSTVYIKGKGSVILKYKTGEVRVFQEVYFIPTLYNNIISLGQLSEKGNKVIV